MKCKNKIRVVFMLLLCFLMVEQVNAESTTNRVCANGNYYLLDTPISVTNYVNAIKSGTLNIDALGGHTFSSSKYYEHNGVTKYVKCYNTVSGNSFVINPCNIKYFDDISIANFGNVEDLSDSSIVPEQTLNTSNDTITLKLTVSGDALNVFDKLSVDIVYAGGYGGNVTKDYTNKQIVISNISPSNYKEYKIYVYVNNPTAGDLNNSSEGIAPCVEDGRLFITSLKTTIRNLNSFKVKIPDSFKNSALCTQIKAFAEQEGIQKFFNECYDNNVTIGYEEYKNLSGNLSEKLRKVKEVLNVAAVQTLDTTNLKCYNPNLGITDTNPNALPVGSKTTKRIGNYWMLTCTDNFYIEPSDPQLVRAGGGVEYPNKVRNERSCSITLINSVHKKERCSYGANLMCLDSITGEYRPDAGPNSAFDSCVKKCDGGAYTQACINSCYNSVYKQEKNIISMQGLRSTKLADYNIVKVNDSNDNGSMVYVPSEHQGETLNVGNGYKVEVGNYTASGITEATGQKMTRYIESVLIGPDGSRQAAFSAQLCLQKGLPCKVDTFMTSSSDCSDDPDSEYQAEISRSMSEYNTFLSDATTYVSNIVDYGITFVDSYDKQEYTVKGSTSRSVDGVALDIKDSGIKVTGKTDQAVQVGSETSINATVAVTTRTDYTIELPIQYSVKGQSSKIIVNGTNGKYEKSNNKSGVYTFKNFKIESEKLLSTGERVYYTSLDSKDYNVEVQKEATKLTTIDRAKVNPDSLMGRVATINELRKEYENSGSKLKFNEYLLTSGNYYTDLFSYNPFAAYIQNEEFVVKTLKENDDNIKVTYEFGTIGDKYGNNDHITSQYSCYYGVYNMIKKDEDTKGNGLRYYYHEINPENIFDKREARWNWTGTIKNDGTTSGAARIVTRKYIVDPERLIKYIEDKGNTIYTNEGTQQSEMDYHFTLDYATIRSIRNYNKTKVNGKKISYTDFSLADAKNSFGENYSLKVRDWLGDSFNQKAMAISPCNNSLAGACYNYKLGGK